MSEVALNIEVNKTVGGTCATFDVIRNNVSLSFTKSRWPLTGILRTMRIWIQGAKSMRIHAAPDPGQTITSKQVEF
jgi:hypothetical protein